jgi:hypothetical protein
MHAVADRAPRPKLIATPHVHHRGSAPAGGTDHCRELHRDVGRGCAGVHKGDRDVTTVQWAHPNLVRGRLDDDLWAERRRILVDGDCMRIPRTGAGLEN